MVKGWGIRCGHAELPLSYNSDLKCAECHGTYAAHQEWLKCNLCDQWFHDECFLTYCFFHIISFFIY